MTNVNPDSQQSNRIAARANKAAYDGELTAHYGETAPHLLHSSLIATYAELVDRVFQDAIKNNPTPRVLDLGAGEGSVTYSFLKLGAFVTAVDLSESQLKELSRKCQSFADRLEIRVQDVHEALASLPKSYDIIVANSFLHHIPDYLSLIRDSLALLSPHGQFFSFQDPLRYDSLGMINRCFSWGAHYSWRIFQSDVIGGLKRYLRRKRGVFLDQSTEDNMEYHFVRNGVDQDAIRSLLETAGFHCEIKNYFSTMSSRWQTLGEKLSMNNTFAVLARR